MELVASASLLRRQRDLTLRGRNSELLGCSSFAIRSAISAEFVEETTSSPSFCRLGSSFGGLGFGVLRAAVDWPSSGSAREEVSKSKSGSDFKDASKHGSGNFPDSATLLSWAITAVGSSL